MKKAACSILMIIFVMASFNIPTSISSSTTYGNLISVKQIDHPAAPGIFWLAIFTFDQNVGTQHLDYQQYKINGINVAQHYAKDVISLYQDAGYPKQINLAIHQTKYTNFNLKRDFTDKIEFIPDTLVWRPSEDTPKLLGIRQMDHPANPGHFWLSTFVYDRPVDKDYLDPNQYWVNGIRFGNHSDGQTAYIYSEPQKKSEVTIVIHSSKYSAYNLKRDKTDYFQFLQETVLYSADVKMPENAVVGARGNIVLSGNGSNFGEIQNNSEGISIAFWRHNNDTLRVGLHEFKRPDGQNNSDLQIRKDVVYKNEFNISLKVNFQTSNFMLYVDNIPINDVNWNTTFNPKKTSSIVFGTNYQNVQGWSGHNGVLTFLTQFPPTLHARYKNDSLQFTYKDLSYDQKINLYRFNVKNNIISDIAPAKSVVDFKNELNPVIGHTVKIFDKDGNEKVSGNIGTGTRVAVYQGNVKSQEYETLVVGDITGDGGIGIVDLARLKQHMLGISNLTGIEIDAADIYNKGRVTLSDMVAVRRHVSGIRNINQNRLQEKRLDITNRNKNVSILYLPWFNDHVKENEEIYNISEILRDNPNNPVWGPKHAKHFWAEPELGYYRSDDVEIQKTHMRQIYEMGVDFLVIDATNFTDLWPLWYQNQIIWDSVDLLLETMLEMRKSGEKTPYLMFWVGTLTNSNDPLTGPMEIYNRYYQSKKYDELFVYYYGKPLINVTHIIPQDISQYFTVRKKWGMRTTLPSGEWSGLEKYPQRPGVSGGVVEHVVVGAATQLSHMNVFQKVGIYEPPHTRNGGRYYASQWSRAFELNPKIVFLTEWNSWSALRFVENINNVEHTFFTDAYNMERSRCLEPMKYGYKDLYYQWTKQYIQAFKSGLPMPLGLHIQAQEHVMTWD